MSNVKCPNCELEIENPLNYCSYCGTPLNTDDIVENVSFDNVMCEIGDKKYNLTDFRKYVHSKGEPGRERVFDVAIRFSQIITGTTVSDILNLMILIERTGKVPEKFYIKRYSKGPIKGTGYSSPKPNKLILDRDIVYCPKCGLMNEVARYGCQICHHLDTDLSWENRCMVGFNIYDMDGLVKKIVSDSELTDEELCELKKVICTVLPDCTERHADALIQHIKITGSAPKKFGLSERVVMSARSISNTIHCPRCNSTAISTGARGYSFWGGWKGSGRTMNRCGNCGYKWEPRARL